MFWGILGVVFIYIIQPFISELIEQVEPKILYPITYAIITYMLIDLIISIINLNSISKKIDKIKEISENIKIKLSEIKKKANTPITIEGIEQVIEDLKKQEEILREKLIKQTNNLKKRFPTMKSEKISDFLNHRKR